MLPEIILKILLEKSLNQGKTIFDKYFDNFDKIVNETCSYFERKYFGFSGTNLKEFLNSSEFKNQLLHHDNYRDLDYDSLGNVLSSYINVAEGISAKEILLEFFIELENNINKQPELRNQLILEYQRSHDRKLSNIQKSVDDIEQQK